MGYKRMETMSIPKQMLSYDVTLGQLTLCSTLPAVDVADFGKSTVRSQPKHNQTGRRLSRCDYDLRSTGKFR
jgi:hypothetical protein